MLACALTCVLALASTAAAAFPTQDDRTPGAMAISWRKQTNIWGRTEGTFVDGKVTTSPPDITRYDRRLETFVDGGFDLGLGRFGVRFDVKALNVQRRQLEETAPSILIDEKYTTLTPSSDLTFVTDKGLEIFVGSAMVYTPGYKQTVDASLIDSSTTYDRSRLQYNRAGVVRRAGSWAGGFYYCFDKTSSRHYVKEASDGSSLEGADVIFVPARVAMLGEVGAGSALWDFEFAFLQARGKGPTDDAGKTTYTDHFEARAGSTFGFGKTLNFKLGLAHRTLAYANSANITMETIPVSTARLMMLLGDAKAHTALGVIYGYGKDGQSIPEFNATYEVAAYGFTVGFFYPL